MAQGKLEKLTIKAFKKKDFSGSVGEFQVRINPDEYTHSFGITYNDVQPEGAPASTPKFRYVGPEEVSFTLHFEGTGAIPGNTDVSGQVKKFLGLAYNYNGDIHSPNFLKLSWGNFLFKCRLENLSIQYTLFKPNGTPLRAKAQATFKEYLSEAEIAKRTQKSSPDITHLRTVRALDTLPEMCYQIYGDSRYYLEVAAANDLNDFRNLPEGMQLFFPPIKK